jgi:hypothetical protein
MRLSTKVSAIVFLLSASFAGRAYADPPLLAECGTACSLPCCSDAPEAYDCNYVCNVCEPELTGREDGDCNAFIGIGQPYIPGTICDCTFLIDQQK